MSDNLNSGLWFKCKSLLAIPIHSSFVKSDLR